MKTRLTIFFLFITIVLIAQEKTFEREYTYKASELDSKISCRAITINELRTQLLNEIGVYVESESILKTSDVSGKFAQDFVENIATISAGITKIEVLEEKWNGETFWMRASITIDKKSLEESLKQLVADRQKLKELEEVKQKLNDATEEINRLNEELVTNKNTEQVAQSVKYDKEISTLAASNYYYSGQVKFLLQDFKGAITEFNMAIEINPNYDDAYFDRGNSKMELQDYKGA